MSILNLAKQLTNSLAEWSAQGRPVVTKEVLDERLSICRKCSYWQEIAKTRVAKCRKCGCSSAKLLMGTSKCPLVPPKWDKVSTNK